MGQKGLDDDDDDDSLIVKIRLRSSNLVPPTGLEYTDINPYG